MKKMWNGEFLPGMEELQAEEASAITGGESLWYWVGYAMGSTIYMFSHENGVQSSGQKLMNAALG